MPTEVVQVDAQSPDSVILRRAGEILRAGGLVAFPTETVYGLGAAALDENAVRKIFEAKGRPATNPLIVHISRLNQIDSLVAVWPDSARKLADHFWPGPLTIVVEKSIAVPDIVTAGGPTIAIRMPAHPVAKALLDAAGVPIAAPSANRSGELSPTTASHVFKGLQGKIDMILDAGPCPGGIESTVIDASGTNVRLLRPGPITLEQLEQVVGKIDVGSTGSSEMPARSPGLLTRHYAPRTALECVDTEAELKYLTDLYTTAGLKVVHLKLPSDPIECANRLYADLHSLDGLGADRILTLLPPNSDAWRAIRDRLTRASAEE